MRSTGNIDFYEKEKYGEMVAVVGPDKTLGLSIAIKLRQNQIIAENFSNTQKLKKQMSKANAMNKNLQCLIFAFPNELKVKDMWTGNEKIIQENQLIDTVNEVFEDGFY